MKWTIFMIVRFELFAYFLISIYAFYWWHLFAVKIIALQGRERKLLLTNRGQSLEIIELTCQLSAFEEMKEDYLQSILDAKQSNEEHSDRRMELERKICADDRVTRTKELADLRQL
jgi:hypothetical protein